MREITAIEFFVILLLVVALCLHWMTASAQELTAREIFLNDARAAAMMAKPDSITCFQETRSKQTHICITKAEWLRIHEEERQQNAKQP